tara:strand:+ start:9727 stop:11055 length:1329 start_codon:yes stop_codon:yes gene_type:complete
MASTAIMGLMKALGQKLPKTVTKTKPIIKKDKNKSNEITKKQFIKIRKTKKDLGSQVSTADKGKYNILNRKLDDALKDKDKSSALETISKMESFISKTKTSKFGSLAEAKIAAQKRGAKTFRYEGKVYKTPIKDSKRVRQNLSGDIKAPKERQKEKKYLIDKTLNSLPGGKNRFKVDPKNKNKLIDKQTGKTVGITEMSQMFKTGKTPTPMRKQTLTKRGEELLDEGNFKKILNNPKKYMYEGTNSPLTPKQQPPKTKADREVAKEKFEELSEDQKVDFIRNIIEPELTSKQISDVLGTTSRSQAVKLPKSTIRKIDKSKSIPKGELIKRLIDVAERKLKDKALSNAAKDKLNAQIKKLALRFNKGKNIIDDVTEGATSKSIEDEITSVGGFQIKQFKKGGKLSSKKKKIIKPKTIKVAKKKSAPRGVGAAKRGYGKAMGRA